MDGIRSDRIFGEGQLPCFPLDRPRADFNSFLRDSCSIVIDTIVLDHVRAKRIDPVALLLAAAGTVLARHCDQQDILCGLLANFDEHSIDRSQNPVVLPVHIDFSLCDTGRDVFDAVGSCLSDSSGLINSPTLTQNATSALHDFERACNLLILVQTDEPQLFNLALTESQVDTVRDKLADCDFNLRLKIGPIQMELMIDFNLELFDTQRMDALIGQIEKALRWYADSVNQTVQSLELLSEMDRQLVITQWNNTARDYPREATLWSLFQQQVARTPDAVAVFDEHRSVSYQAFFDQVVALAAELRIVGVKPDSIVAIQMQRSISMLQAIYAVLCASGAYLPIDPQLPFQRRIFMIKDAAVNLVIADADDDQLASVAGNTVLIFDDWLKRTEVAPADLQNSGAHVADLSASNLAYVIYTSGSTGVPKGVMIEHQAICNRLQWMQEAFAISARDRVIQKTPMTFDVSVWEIFWPLQTGAALFVAAPEGHKDSAYLKKSFITNRITIAHFVPSMLDSFLLESDVEQCRDLRMLFSIGEELSMSSVIRCQHRLPAALHNLYGPTEAAVVATHWYCDPANSDGVVPIGRPIANTQIYILDSNQRPVAIGAIGEMYIGGAQVARGYLNRAELNTEKFISNPFIDSSNNRMYRSGDRARWRSNGTLEFLGRIDGQIKLRGHRVELGEIEAALKRCAGVSAAVVLVSEPDQGDQRLSGFVMLDRAGAVDTDSLRASLTATLPAHMVPAELRAIDQFPLTNNGKLDKKALVSLLREPAAVSDQQTDKNENALTRIWQDVLGKGQIGPDDNFFDLGGHSLLIFKVRSALHETLGIEISVTDLFRYPTINSLSKFLCLLPSGKISAPPDLKQRR